MDAYREAGTFVVHLDLPGGSAESIDLTVEQNVLTVHAERRPRQESAPRAWSTTRPYGVFSRQPFLGTLDADRLKRGLRHRRTDLDHSDRREDQARQGSRSPAAPSAAD